MRLEMIEDSPKIETYVRPSWPTAGHAAEIAPAYAAAGIIGLLLSGVIALVYSYPFWVAAFVLGACFMGLSSALWKSGGRTMLIRFVTRHTTFRH